MLSPEPFPAQGLCMQVVQVRLYWSRGVAEAVNSVIHSETASC